MRSAHQQQQASNRDDQTAQFCAAILASRAERIRERGDSWENTPKRLALPGLAHGKRHPGDDDVKAEANVIFKTPMGKACVEEGLGNCVMELVADREITLEMGITQDNLLKMRDIHRKFLGSLAKIDSVGNAWGGWGIAVQKLGTTIANNAQTLRERHA